MIENRPQALLAWWRLSVLLSVGGSLYCPCSRVVLTNYEWARGVLWF
jgi:hypothetical protein